MEKSISGLSMLSSNLSTSEKIQRLKLTIQNQKTKIKIIQRQKQEINQRLQSSLKVIQENKKKQKAYLVDLKVLRTELNEVRDYSRKIQRKLTLQVQNNEKVIQGKISKQQLEKYASYKSTTGLKGQYRSFDGIISAIKSQNKSIKLPDMLNNPEFSNVQSLIHQKEIELKQLKTKFDPDSYLGRHSQRSRPMSSKTRASRPKTPASNNSAYKLFSPNQIRGKNQMRRPPSANMIGKRKVMFNDFIKEDTNFFVKVSNEERESISTINDDTVKYKSLGPKVFSTPNLGNHLKS